MKLRSLEMRRQGLSIKEISKELGVAKSSVSVWVRDVPLSTIQKARLKINEVKGRELGLFKTMQIKRAKRATFLAEFDNLGINRLTSITQNELFVLGVGLYWAEGGKSNKNRRVEFCNSDPRMIKFLLLWLKLCFKVPTEDLRLIIGINQIHETREMVVKEYWSKSMGIPLDQFRKTSFKRVMNSKVYENFESHYGTLTVMVAKSTNLYYEIMGLIKGLVQAKITAG